MRTFLAETVPHRARFAWLGAALVASIAAFVLTRPHAPPAPKMSAWAVGACSEHVHAVRVDVVPSYHHHH